MAYSLRYLALTVAWMVSGAVACAAGGSDDTPDEPDIVGGKADRGHPYVVGLGPDGPYCSATIISQSTVLAAGHCGQSTFLRVWFGYAGDEGSIKVVAAARDPRWTSVGTGEAEHVNFDVAVYKLAHPVAAKIQAAPLLRETMANTPTYIGPRLTFVGYGNPHFGKKWMVAFPISLVGPATIPNHGFTDSIDESQFYYRVPHKNTCNGDSGGPAFFIKDGVEHLAGVTSAGDDACTKDGTDARSDLPGIQSFIQAKIDAFEGNDPCRSDGTCNESCNRDGFVGDPDCAVNHCRADGICASACVGDPDCTDAAPDLASPAAVAAEAAKSCTGYYPDPVCCKADSTCYANCIDKGVLDADCAPSVACAQPVIPPGAPVRKLAQPRRMYSVPAYSPIHGSHIPEGDYVLSSWFVKNDTTGMARGSIHVSYATNGDPLLRYAYLPDGSSPMNGTLWRSPLYGYEVCPAVSGSPTSEFDIHQFTVTASGKYEFCLDEQSSYTSQRCFMAP